MFQVLSSNTINKVEMSYSFTRSNKSRTQKQPGIFIAISPPDFLAEGFCWW